MWISVAACARCSQRTAVGRERTSSPLRVRGIALRERMVPAGRRPRELRILVTQLEASLSESSGLELDRAIREHHVLRGRSLRTRRKRLDSADPRGEILARDLRRVARRSIAGDKPIKETARPLPTLVPSAG